MQLKLKSAARRDVGLSSDSLSSMCSQTTSALGRGPQSAMMSRSNHNRHPNVRHLDDGFTHQQSVRVVFVCLPLCACLMWWWGSLWWFSRVLAAPCLPADCQPGQQQLERDEWHHEHHEWWS